ncbi:MAG: GDP-mannose 4,6-dehydratase [Chloroflexi bacterium]|nr:GDP-mannose 4,6-dehydratase [Chloroflexota bacterium]
MRALITGITGFVGRHLARYLRQVGDEVFGIASPRASLEGAEVEGERIIQADLNEPSAVVRALEAFRPEAIYHLAAQASIPRAWEDPGRTLYNNINAQLNLFQATLALRLEPFILVVGSADEYGRVRPEDIPVDEETPLRPVNPYAVSKLAQDYLGLQYHLSHRMHVVRVRPFNHIGPGQGLGFVVPDFCYQLARIEAGLQPPTLRVGNLEAQRDFTDVRDIVRGYHLALTRGQAGQVYNLGSSQAWAIRDLLDRLLALSTAEVQVEQDPERMRPSDVPIIVSDCRRIRQEVGWEPYIPLEQSLRDTLDDWRDRIRKDRA